MTTHTQTRLTALCLGLSGWAGTRKVKPICILLKQLEQETVTGCGISWAICKSAPCSRQITTPVPHHSIQAGCPSCHPTNSVIALTTTLSYLTDEVNCAWHSWTLMTATTLCLSCFRSYSELMTADGIGFFGGFLPRCLKWRLPELFCSLHIQYKQAVLCCFWIRCCFGILF